MPQFRCKTVVQQGIPNAGKIPLTIIRGCTLPNTQFQLLALVLVSQATRVRHFRGFIRPEFRATTLGYFGTRLFREDSE
jgi:hypothetical protein